METTSLKKGDKVYYLTINNDNRIISTIEKGYHDRRRDEKMILFYTSSAGIVKKVNNKSVRILDAFKGTVETIPANRVFPFDPAGYEQAMEEVNRLNNRILKKLNTRIKEGWELGYFYP
jgi:hypothetical protein